MDGGDGGDGGGGRTDSDLQSPRCLPGGGGGGGGRGSGGGRGEDEAPATHTVYEVMVSKGDKVRDVIVGVVKLLALVKLQPGLGVAAACPPC